MGVADTRLGSPWIVARVMSKETMDIWWFLRGLVVGILG